MSSNSQVSACFYFSTSLDSRRALPHPERCVSNGVEITVGICFNAHILLLKVLIRYSKSRFLTAQEDERDCSQNHLRPQHKSDPFNLEKTVPTQLKMSRFPRVPSSAAQGHYGNCSPKTQRHSSEDSGNCGSLHRLHACAKALALALPPPPVASG